MTKYLTYLLIVASFLFCQCAGNQDDDGNGSDYPTVETFMAIDSCMSFMQSDPGKAHVMLDSLMEARLMTKARCDYFHAMVVFWGENNLDSALMICDRLLDEGEFGDDRYLEEEICVLASNITFVNDRHLETLKYANRGIAICHGDAKMHEDEATLMGRVGVAEHGLGRIEKARETYARARKLLKENKSFADFVALISLQKKEAGLCKEVKDYDGLISICHDVIGKVERFDRDPSFVEQRPITMQKSCDTTHDFAKIYKDQMYASLASAYRLKIQTGQSENVQSDMDSLNAYIDKWNEVDENHSPDDFAAMLPELYFVGRKAQFEEAKLAAENLYRNDSILVEFADYLTLIADEAADRNDYKASASYLRRAVVVNDSIRQRDLARKLTEQLSINMVQEEQLARQDAEYDVKKLKLIICLLLVIFAAGIVITILVRRNKECKKIIEVTQHDLTESKEEILGLVHRLEEAKKDRVIRHTKSLYERIEKEMSVANLYLNSELDIMMMADLVGSSRSAVSSCVNKVTGKSFRQWLSEYRLVKFEQMMRENMEKPIEELILKCGYKDQSTFRRQFKTKFGMTVVEYKKMLMNEIGIVGNKEKIDFVDEEMDVENEEIDVVDEEMDVIDEETDFVDEEMDVVDEETDVVDEEIDVMEEEENTRK